MSTNSLFQGTDSKSAKPEVSGLSRVCSWWGLEKNGEAKEDVRPKDFVKGCGECWWVRRGWTRIDVSPYDLVVF